MSPVGVFTESQQVWFTQEDLAPEGHAGQLLQQLGSDPGDQEPAGFKQLKPLENNMTVVRFFSFFFA